jgi:hypothetical protein
MRRRTLGVRRRHMKKGCTYADVSPKPESRLLLYESVVKNLYEIVQKTYARPQTTLRW